MNTLKKVVLVSALVLGSASSMAENLITMHSRSEFPFNRYVGDAHISKVVLESGVWTHSVCRDERVRGNPRYSDLMMVMPCHDSANVTSEHLKVYIGITWPRCTGMTHLKGNIIVRFTGRNGSTFKAVYNANAPRGIDGAIVDFAKFPGRWDTEGNINVEDNTSCGIF